jgi:Rad51
MGMQPLPETQTHHFDRYSSSQCGPLTPLSFFCWFLSMPGSVDELLSGGIRSGQLTELVGESGSGKTQLCLSTAVATAVHGGRVWYLDTSNSLRSERLLAMHRRFTQGLQVNGSCTRWHVCFPCDPGRHCKRSRAQLWLHGTQCLELPVCHQLCIRHAAGACIPAASGSSLKPIGYTWFYLAFPQL